MTNAADTERYWQMWRDTIEYTTDELREILRAREAMDRMGDAPADGRAKAKKTGTKIHLTRGQVRAVCDWLRMGHSARATAKMFAAQYGTSVSYQRLLREPSIRATYDELYASDEDAEGLGIL